MKPARIVFSVAAAIICAAIFIITSGASFQAQAGVAGDLWNQAASDGKTQSKASPTPDTTTPATKSTETATKGSLGKIWDKAASSEKSATPAKQSAQPPDPSEPKEPAEPTQDISDWQLTKFLGIVEMLFPPDAKQYTDHKNDLLWVVGKYYEYKLFFGAEMVRDPMAKAKSMKVTEETKATLNGPVGKNWICCFQYDGTMNIGGKDIPARLITTADPLPNGMYLAFWVCGKDLKARQNDVDVFFESIRIHMPEGDDYWQWNQWRGLKFKTPWGWMRYKNNDWANDYKGYERGTGREMTFGLGWSKTPYEKELEELKRLNNVTELGGNTINGVPVKMYELASGPGQPFAATLLASVQVPLKSGGYIQVSGSVEGGDKWGDARKLIEEMMQSVTPAAETFDMSAAPPAAATPKAQPTGAAPVQLPEPPLEPTATTAPADQPSGNTLPNEPLPENTGNLPIASTPEPIEPVQTTTGNPTPDSAPPENIGNLPMTATPTPHVNATPDTVAPETQGNPPLPAATEQAQPEQTPAAAAQAGVQAESSCKLKTLRGFYDKTGRGEDMHGDGSPEAVLELKFKAAGRTIEAMTIKSTQGQPAQWDTIPGNGHWLVVITEKGKALNSPDGSVAIKLGDKTRKFGLLIQDNNALASGKGVFVVEVQLDGGETIEIPVQQ